MRGILLNGAAGIFIGAFLSTPVLAIQDAPATGSATQVQTEAGVAAYQPGFFTDYAPVTALDMVSRVPGFGLSNGDTSRRGLGDAFGNLLINGRRPSNKSLSLETVLQRIPVDDVERIELIQEALPQYDMRGHSRLVNVVLREGAGRSGSWDARVQISDSGRLGPRIIASYTTPVGPTEMTFGLDTGMSGNRLRRRESRHDASGVEFARGSDNDQRQYEEFAPSWSMNWDINDNSRLRMDARANLWTWHRVRFAEYYSVSGATLTPHRLEHNETENHGSLYSGTLSYQRDLNEEISLETMLLATRERWEDGPEAYENYDPVSGFTDSIIVSAGAEMEETALRQTLSWDPNDRHSLEFGGEHASNSRETHLALSENDGTTITPIDLPVAETRVEESRSEIFANHVWQINDRFSLESGLRYEFSEIAQTGDAQQTRSFTYPKPSVTLNYRSDDRNRFRFTGRRDVDQLDFGKFASSVDVTDNNSTLGNPDYVPQRTWTLEGEWERRFGDAGSFSLQIGYDWVEDLDGWVSIVTPTGVFDAPGNIGDGTNLRVTGNLTTPLDTLGINNAVLDVFLEWYDTNVEDPLTGENRQWSGTREWELRLDYRQTFPQSQMAWGWDYFWLSDGEVHRSREFQHHDNTDGDLDIYVETTRFFGVTLRAQVDAVFNTGDDRQRIFYDGSRASGIIDGIDYRNTSMGRTFQISARSTF
ncbi:outer membrane receptor protein involved in Fe transport [Maricaulis maris]|uniref:Outer membrane receptor protein involved in Fe transport n=1 Tax=Maricaulis maris TaxID=74318 RepID=A0A495DDQ3_9PROT|nr:outer membrane receptor protein involved in Fe transport [Maricaulis maris]